MPRLLLLTASLALLLGFALPLEGLAEEPGPVAGEVKVYADRMDYDESTSVLRLVGRVRFVTRQATLTAPFARYNTRTQVAELQGGVKVSQPGTTLIGDRMRVDHGRRAGVLRGNVRLVSEKAPGALQGQPAVLHTDRLEYSWEEGIGQATGGVKVRQGDRRAFADRAVYRKTEQQIDLEGAVRFERGQDDWLTSDSARMDLQAETMEARGQVVGRFVVEDPGASRAPQAASPKPSPAPLAPEVIVPELPLETELLIPEMKLPGLDD